ncbi:hypothetical protein [Roseovarius sp. M141]|uniref:hypothetical protein n=1 Tax=Roseovarius sp. M141 TaxID=2583806 RepID=UPI0020CDEA8A|nr:hypothetical protein [Roseovarius sp. M141]MCQ0091387.1 hypothetical protein [Roseovarius sp. M141]
MPATTAPTMPGFGAAPPAPPNAADAVEPAPSIAAWSFHTDPHGWRGVAAAPGAGTPPLTLACTRPGAIPAAYPGESIRAHEPGVLNLLIAPAALVASGDVGAPGERTFTVAVSVDGRSLGQAPAILIAPEGRVATNLPLDHPIVDAMKVGGRLALEEATTGATIAVALTGSRDALDRLAAFCARPLPPAPASVASGTASPAGAAATAAPNTKGLVMIDGRVALWSGTMDGTALGFDAAVVDAHERALGRRLYLTALVRGVDDLEAALATETEPARLWPMFRILDAQAQRRVRDLALTLASFNGAQRERCTAAEGEQQLWNCGTQLVESTFDRRRVAQAISTEVVAATRAEAFEGPLDVTVLCGLGNRFEAAYDFPTGSIHWGRLVNAGACGAVEPTDKVDGFDRLAQQTATLELDGLRSVTTPMAVEEAETLIRSMPADPAEAGGPRRPMMLQFPARIDLTRINLQPDAQGRWRLDLNLLRTGPAEIRWSGRPTEAVMRFDAPTSLAAAVASNADEGLAMGEGGLVRMAGQPVVWAGSVDGRALGLDDAAVRAHEATLAEAVRATTLFASADDLEATLAAEEDPDRLRRHFDALPQDAQDRIRDAGLALAAPDTTRRSVCSATVGTAAWGCAVGSLETTFDRRRITQVIAAEVAAAAKAAAFDGPLELRMLCGLNRPVDQAYDFERVALRWDRMIDAGQCEGIGALSAVDRGVEVVVEHRLGAAVPVETPMTQAEAENWITQMPFRPTEMDGRIRPMMLTFPATLTVARAGGDDGAAVRVRVARTGAVDLRWTGRPGERVMSFEAEAAAAAVPEASEAQDGAPLDLSDNRSVAAAIETAPLLDAAQTEEAAAAFRLAPERLEGHPVRLPAYVEKRDGAQRFRLVDYIVEAEAAARLAQRMGLPPEAVAWTQVLGNGPAPEAMIILPRPLASVESGPVPEGLLAEGGGAAVLVGRIGHLRQTEGEAGPALVGFVLPERFEVMGRDVAGDPRVAGTVEVAPAPAASATAPATRLFVPGPSWYLMRAAELAGVDPGEHIDAALAATGQFQLDVFARLDAAEASLAAARALAAAHENEEPWVTGTLALGPYDLEREAYPIRSFSVSAPPVDGVERALLREGMPRVAQRGTWFLLPLAEARARRDTVNATTTYPARARLLLGPPEQGRRSPSARIGAVSILEPAASSSRPVMVPTTVREGDALWTVEAVQE